MAVSVRDTGQGNTKRMKVDLKSAHLFSHESRLKKEAKGGYLEGKIQLPGAPEDLESVELMLTSELHKSGHHCNFLYLTGTGYKKDKKVVKSNKGEEDWKVCLINDNGTLKLNDNTHDYMKNMFTENFWDKQSNTILLGRGKLQSTIAYPLSKGSNDFKCVLRQRLCSDKEIKEITELCKPGEPFLHLARLKVIAKLKGSVDDIIAFSNLICDKSRYEIKSSYIPNSVILNNTFLQRLPIVPEKCMPPEKVNFSCNFVYQNDDCPGTIKIPVPEDEIKIVQVNRTGHEKKCVDVWFRTGSGNVLSAAINKKSKIYLQLRVLENGNLGAAKDYYSIISSSIFEEIEIGRCIEHKCKFMYNSKCSEALNVEKKFKLQELRKLQMDMEYVALANNNCSDCHRVAENLKQLEKTPIKERINGNKKRHHSENYSADEDVYKHPKVQSEIEETDSGNKGVSNITCSFDSSTSSCNNASLSSNFQGLESKTPFHWPMVVYTQPVQDQVSRSTTFLQPDGGLNNSVQNWCETQSTHTESSCSVNEYLPNANPDVSNLIDNGSINFQPNGVLSIEMDNTVSPSLCIYSQAIPLFSSLDPTVPSGSPTMTRSISTVSNTETLAWIQNDNNIVDDILLKNALDNRPCYVQKQSTITEDSFSVNENLPNANPDVSNLIDNGSMNFKPKGVLSLEMDDTVSPSLCINSQAIPCSNSLDPTMPSDSPTITRSLATVSNSESIGWIQIDGQNDNNIVDDILLEQVSDDLPCDFDKRLFTKRCESVGIAYDIVYYSCIELHIIRVSLDHADLVSSKLSLMESAILSLLDRSMDQLRIE